MKKLLLLLILLPVIAWADGPGVIHYKADCSGDIAKGRICCDSSTGICYFGTGVAAKKIIQEDSIVDGTVATLSNIPASSLKAISAFTDEQCVTYEATGDGFETVSCGSPGTLTRQCKTLFDPIDADAPVFGIAAAWTVDRITYFCSGGTSVVFTLQECDNQAANCSAIEAAITCTSGNAVANVATTDIDNRGLDADDIIKLDIGTVTGTVEYLTVCFEASL